MRIVARWKEADYRPGDDPGYLRCMAQMLQAAAACYPEGVRRESLLQRAQTLRERADSLPADGTPPA